MKFEEKAATAEEVPFEIGTENAKTASENATPVRRTRKVRAVVAGKPEEIEY
jgi:hypothetical protein